jgi:DUF1365 family protein
MESALYFGHVRHRRFAPRACRFAYPLFQLYADLDELPALFRGSALASTRRPAWAWLRRADYFGDRDRPWAEAVRAEVGARLGRPLDGAVRLLTHPRTLGVRMNPVSFYYCFAAGGALEAVAAEITNTPWRERHVYVVDAAGERRGESFGARFPKQFHVSPFLPMDLEYRWRFTPPGERLAVHMEDWRAGERLFDATLSLARRELTPATLRRALVVYPALTLRVLAWIYLHAAILKLRGVPYLPHPKSTAAEPEASPARSTAPPPADSPPASRDGSSRAA